MVRDWGRANSDIAKKSGGFTHLLIRLQLKQKLINIIRANFNNTISSEIIHGNNDMADRVFSVICCCCAGCLLFLLVTTFFSSYLLNFSIILGTHARSYRFMLSLVLLKHSPSFASSQFCITFWCWWLLFYFVFATLSFVYHPKHYIKILLKHIRIYCVRARGNSLQYAASIKESIECCLVCIL